jgi:hypothetical protein
VGGVWFSIAEGVVPLLLFFLPLDIRLSIENLSEASL